MKEFIASDIGSEMKEVETAVEEDRREKELAGVVLAVKLCKHVWLWTPNKTLYIM